MVFCPGLALCICLLGSTHAPPRAPPFSTCFPSVAFSKTVFKTSVAISSSPVRFCVHAKYLISFVPLAISSSHHLTPSSGCWSPHSNPSFILQLAPLDLNYSLLSPACPPACCFLWITRKQGWNPTDSFNTQTVTHLQSNLQDSSAEISLPRIHVSP